jgi:Zn-finger nucleic acid-binding protein
VKCPNCKEHLARANRAGDETRECFYCEGIWIGHAALEQLVGRETGVTANRLRELDPIVAAAPKGSRACPACDTLLNVLSLEGLELDCCSTCLGMFFDKSELARLLPNTQDEKYGLGVGTYVASESLGWVIIAAISSLISPC